MDHLNHDELQNRLANLRFQYEDASIKYQNMKDRQSFRILGFVTGVILCLIGIILGQTWPIRILLLISGLAIFLGTYFGIQKISINELEKQAGIVQNLQDQVNTLKRSLKTSENRRL
jgi:ABC-type lipoprotein release transport system permease subunit